MVQCQGKFAEPFLFKAAKSRGHARAHANLFCMLFFPIPILEHLWFCHFAILQTSKVGKTCSMLPAIFPVPTEAPLNSAHATWCQSWLVACGEVAGKRIWKGRNKTKQGYGCSTAVCFPGLCKTEKAFKKYIFRKKHVHFICLVRSKNSRSPKKLFLFQPPS